jgi:hypothetical protein
MRRRSMMRPYLTCDHAFRADVVALMRCGQSTKALGHADYLLGI